jgi:hypothetical protein
MPTATRKQVYDLTLADLEAAPVWEFALDEEGVAGQDEATVRPYVVAFPIDAAGHGGLVVSAAFRLADGTSLRGYFSPQPMSLSQPGWIQPVVICDAGQVNFWHGIQRPTQNQMMDELVKLGKQAAEVFPLRYRSDVEVVGGPISGIIPGFGFKENKADMFIGPDGTAHPYGTMDTNSRS